MIIQRKTIDIPDLSLQVLEACPAGENVVFRKGYAEFVDQFFSDLELFAEAFSDHWTGRFETDLDLDLEISLESVEFQFSLLPLDQKKNYWAGVQLAVTNSCNILNLAYETVDLKKAA